MAACWLCESGRRAVSAAPPDAGQAFAPQSAADVAAAEVTAADVTAGESTAEA